MPLDLALIADVLRVTSALPVFVYASYRDVLERRVRNEVWYPLVVIGVLALGFDLVAGDPVRVLTFAGISIGIGGPFAFIFYRLGAFGGADMKALIVLSLLFPVYPEFMLPIVGNIPKILPNVPIFILSLLGNTVLVGVFYPLSLLVRNIGERNLGNPLLMVVGKKIEVSELDESYGRILVDDDGLTFSGTDLDFFRDYTEWMDVESLNELEGEDLKLEEFVEETAWISDDIDEDEREIRRLIGERGVWITPGIPFVVPMTLGLILALTAGDLLFLILDSAFGMF